MKMILNERLSGDNIQCDAHNEQGNMNVCMYVEYDVDDDSYMFTYYGNDDSDINIDNV